MFEILSQHGKRRLGRLQTMHGDIFTPAFGPDATRGTIKNLAVNEFLDLDGRADPEILKSADAGMSHDNKIRREHDEIQFILSNTYHLRSYPGDEFIRDMGGLHEFMRWPLPILTDSGGFQVFSLIHGAKNLKGKVTDDGAFFNNPINGDRLALTPESAIDIQFNFGSDVMIVLDDCRHYQDTRELKHSVYRTIEWAKRCKARFEERLASPAHDSRQPVKQNNVKRPLLFAVVQGGIDYE
ncbi:MAG: tRNA-guanine transglycosylase, partial [Candidatus Dojkabacteria bacterium]